MRSFLSAKPMSLSTHVGSEKPNLRDANASREGAFKELLLLEKHLSQEQCPECCNKHLFAAIAYLEEACTLLGGDREDFELASALRTEQAELPNVEIRPLRKALAIKLGLASYGGPS